MSSLKGIIDSFAPPWYFDLAKDEIAKAVWAEEWGLVDDAIAHYNNAQRVLVEATSTPRAFLYQPQGEVSERLQALSKRAGGTSVSKYYLEARQLPLLLPLFSINNKYPLAKNIRHNILVILPFRVLGKVGFQNMLNVSCVSSIYFTLLRGKKPNSWVFFGHFRLVDIEPVEVEELVENSAFYRRVNWVSDGLACEDSKYDKTEG
ncbi:hypothetical protein L3X38_013217 [Prunus dulcis]|uniref:MIT domain-containing protein n=1 Tax=Prunus dulcis TaxID=3755 RepID=A0AAD4ZGS3_PRUDU|nr:hypothetical protein L3X38_013217 [Prunus dulcis]